jgi:hypothetical protein
MGNSMFDFSRTVRTSRSQVDDGDPGDLLGLPWFLGEPPEEPIDPNNVPTDTLKKMPGDILGDQIFRV